MVTGTPRMVTDGLVLCLDAANVKSYPGSGTTWTDLSPTVASGSLINGPIFQSTLNGSIWFDSTNDYIPTNITSTYPILTLAAWVYSAKQTPITEQQIISKNYYWATSTDSWPCTLGIFASGTGSFFTITNGTTYQISTGGAQATGSIQFNNWSYIVGTYDKTNVRMYVNGTLTQTVSYTQNINYSGSLSLPWTIGRSAGQQGGGIGGTYSTGSVAIAQIYNRALSTAEVLQNFEATRERFGV